MKTRDLLYWRNGHFVVFSNQCFHNPGRLVCLLKRRKSFFDDLFSLSITWGYKGLQGVTGGYRGLQGVTGVHWGLQGVTEGYRGLQGVTGVHRGLQRVKKTGFLTRTHQILFLRLFSRKIKVEEIFNFVGTKDGLWKSESLLRF